MEKEKLTIEQLAPYLAYDVEFVLSELGIFNLDSEYGTPHQASQPMKITNILIGNEIEIDIQSEKSNWGVGYIGLDEVKPLLYPMEYLTKEINHKGEKFIPVEKIKELTIKIDGVDYGIDYRGKVSYAHCFNYDGKFVAINAMPYWIIKKLYEWHFAVSIPKHLYINKATI